LGEISSRLLEFSPDDHCSSQSSLPVLFPLRCGTSLDLEFLGVSSLGCGITAFWVSSSLGEDAEEDSVDLIWRPRDPVWGFQAMV